MSLDDLVDIAVPAACGLVVGYRVDNTFTHLFDTELMRQVAFGIEPPAEARKVKQKFNVAGRHLRFLSAELVGLLAYCLSEKESEMERLSLGFWSGVSFYLGVHAGKAISEIRRLRKRELSSEEETTYQKALDGIHHQIVHYDKANKTAMKEFGHFIATMDKKYKSKWLLASLYERLCVRLKEAYSHAQLESVIQQAQPSTCIHYDDKQAACHTIMLGDTQVRVLTLTQYEVKTSPECEQSQTDKKARQYALVTEEQETRKWDGSRQQLYAIAKEYIQSGSVVVQRNGEPATLEQARQMIESSVFTIRKTCAAMGEAVVEGILYGKNPAPEQNQP